MNEIDDEILKQYVIPRNLTQNNQHAVGIDLGTSRCCAAVSRKNGIETVGLDYKGERLLPSYVAFDEDKEKCGQLVIERLRHYAQSTVFDSKRIIGINYANVVMDKSWPFKVINVDNKPVIEIKIEKATLRKTPKQIATVLLRYAKQKIEEFQGKPLTKAVITVPAAFSKAQKKATRSAALLAGWDEIELLPEPIAAAFAYFVDRPIPNGSTVLLFDLGGGSLDVCIFKIENNQIEIISNSGDSQLGGRDFDNILYNFFEEKLHFDHGIKVAEDKKYRLMLECQRIKENLSTLDESWLDIDKIDPSKNGIIKINQTKFQSLAVELIDRIRNTLTNALTKIKFDAKEINKVLFVGGGSRMPMIKKLLENMFLRAEHCCEKHPDEVVAVGAAMYASFLTTVPIHSRKMQNQTKNSTTAFLNIQNKPRMSADMQNLIIELNEFPRTGINKNIHNPSIIGIDLGTTRCCAAVIRKNGITTTVPLDYAGERLLPSYVAYDEKNPIFGQVVINRLRQFSRSTIFDSKRIIGRSINEIEIDSNWPFRISEENGKVIIEIKKYNVGVQMTAENVAADLLRYIKRKSEEFQGTILDNVVITVPVSFTNNQKKATIRAARSAGWNNVHLLPEPIAAAFAYFDEQTIPENENILVFDLGGGTLDVCIFKIQNSQIRITSNTEDSKLGGRDFDIVLFNYFKNQLDVKHGISLNRDKKFKLITECQHIKEDLSTVTCRNLSIDEYDTTKYGIIAINRLDFESMTKPLLNKIKNTINAALLNAKHNPENINNILLVGGGSRMPMVKSLLQDIFPEAEQCIHENPDEIVAIGAA